MFQNNKMGHRINKWLFQNNKTGTPENTNGVRQLYGYSWGFIVKFNNVIVVWFGLHTWQVLNANTLDRLIHKTRQQARENNATFTLADVLLVLDISKNNDANEK